MSDTNDAGAAETESTAPVAPAPTPTPTTPSPRPVMTPPVPAAPVVAEPEVESAPADEVEADLHDVFSDDPIGVVVLGDRGGLATLVVRLISGRDDDLYDGGLCEYVKGLQTMYQLEPDGIVQGETWSLILPEVKIGDVGQKVGILLGLLGFPARDNYDLTKAELIDDILDFYDDEPLATENGYASVTRPVWAALINWAREGRPSVYQMSAEREAGLVEARS